MKQSYVLILKILKRVPTDLLCCYLLYRAVPLFLCYRYSRGRVPNTAHNKLAEHRTVYNMYQTRAPQMRSIGSIWVFICAGKQKSEIRINRLFGQYCSAPVSCLFFNNRWWFSCDVLVAMWWVLSVVSWLVRNWSDERDLSKVFEWLMRAMIHRRFSCVGVMWRISFRLIITCVWAVIFAVFRYILVGASLRQTFQLTARTFLLFSNLCQDIVSSSFGAPINSRSYL